MKQKALYKHKITIMKKLLINRFAKVSLHLLLVIVGFSSCSTYPYAYYLETKWKPKRNEKIVIMPMNFNSENEFSKNINYTRLVEKEITNELKLDSFEVHSSKDLIASFDSIKLTCGKFFNPMTGEPDTVVFKRFKEMTNSFVFKKTGADVILYPSLWYTTAYLGNSSIAWHGRNIYNFWYGNWFGRVSALSLFIRFYDKNQNVVFRNAGGIMPLSRVNNGVERIPFEEIIYDPKDVKIATNIALSPIRKYKKNKNASDGSLGY
jgi:hypothetical protein